jgi:peptidyl-prolyl cis-trans isomerase D
MFETMRRNTKLIMWITTGAFVLLIFLAWGAEYQGFGRGSSGRTAGVIGRVNGDPITQMAYSDRINTMRASVQQQGQSMDEATEVQIRNQVWDQMIQETLVEQQIRQRKIVVSDKEIVEAIKTQPIPQVMQSTEFQTNGQFDYSKYLQALADPNRDWTVLESYYRMDLPKQKLQSLVVSSIKVSEAEMKREFQASNTKAKVNYVFVPATRFAVDAAGLSESDMRAYYESHKDDFRMEAQAWVKAVRIDKRPTAADTTAANELIQQAVQDIQKGDDFGELVSAYTEAPPQLRGGAQGSYMTKDQFQTPKVRDAAFSLPIGQVSDVIRDNNGLHILKVEDRRMNGDKEEVKIADIYIPISISGESIQGYQDKATNLAKSVTEEQGNLATAAEAEGLTASDLGPFGRKSFVPRLGQISGFMDWSFNAPPGKMNIMESPDAIYVLQMVKRRPAGLQPFDEIKDRVRTDYATSLQVDQAKQKAEVLLSMAKGGTPLQIAAKGDSAATFDTTDEFSRRGFARGLGNDPAVMARIFSDPIGLVPQVVTTKRGAYVLEILSRTEADESQFASQRDAMRRQIFQRRRGEVVNRWIEDLRAHASIEDFRGDNEL